MFRVSPVLRLLAIALAVPVAGWGCAHAPDPAVAVPAAGSGVAAEGQAAPDAPPAPLQPLTSEEQGLRAELEHEVGALAEFGPRSLAHSWNLFSATDHLARQLEIWGHPVTRHGFLVGEEALQNLEVVLPGRRGETLLVAAHYDTSAESPGVNASASGAAVLLTLAKRLAAQQHHQEHQQERPLLERSLRMVWLCNETGNPTGDPLLQSQPGSAQYSKYLQQSNVPVVATITLGSLGYYSTRSGSQRYPEDLLYGANKRTRLGNFIAVLSNASSNPLLEHVRPVLAAASLPVEELVLPESAPLAADGPQARFWGAGLLGLMLTDTAQFRSAHYDDALDTLDQLDFDRLARVAQLLDQLVLLLAGPLEAEPGAVPLQPVPLQPVPAP